MLNLKIVKVKYVSYIFSLYTAKHTSILPFALYFLPSMKNNSRIQ